jgi:hypothetical protein
MNDEKTKSEDDTNFHFMVGDHITCVDARESNGHLVVDNTYVVSARHGDTNLYIDGTSPHFWHVSRFVHSRSSNAVITPDDDRDTKKAFVDPYVEHRKRIGNDK